jgi:hypothetical protein
VLRADPEQFHRVLSNLVRNARQAIAATGKAGEIRIVGGAGRRLADRGQRHRPRPAEKGARSPVQAVPRRRAQGGLRPRPRHRGGDRPRPWRHAGTGANRPRGHDLRHLPSRGSCSLSATARPGFPLRPLAADAKPRPHAPVAQLDRVLDYESRGRGFESSPVRHFLHLRYRPSGCLSESLLRYRPSGRLSVG